MDASCHHLHMLNFVSGLVLASVGGVTGLLCQLFGPSCVDPVCHVAMGL